MSKIICMCYNAYCRKQIIYNAYRTCYLDVQPLFSQFFVNYDNIVKNYVLVERIQ